MTDVPAPDSIWRWRFEPLPIGLGGSAFGWLIGAYETDAILDRYFDLGGRFIDTSDGYSYAARSDGLDSESLIGSWVRRRGVCDELRIITKVGLCPGMSGLKPDVVRRAVDASLDRLGVPVAEAILAHADDELTSPDEVAEGFSALIGNRARHIGVSRFAPERLSAIVDAAVRMGLTAPGLVQEELSLAERPNIAGLTACAPRSAPIGVVCSAALARGFLTAKFQHATGRVGRRQKFVEENYSTPRHVALLNGLREVSEALGVSPAAVALRWATQHPSVVLPLASVTDPTQLDAFAEAALVRLDDDQWSHLDLLSRALDPESGTEPISGDATK